MSWRKVGQWIRNRIRGLRRNNRDSDSEDTLPLVEERGRETPEGQEEPEPTPQVEGGTEYPPHLNPFEPRDRPRPESSGSSSSSEDFIDFREAPPGARVGRSVFYTRRDPTSPLPPTPPERGDSVYDFPSPPPPYYPSRRARPTVSAPGQLIPWERYADLSRITEATEDGSVSSQEGAGADAGVSTGGGAGHGRVSVGPSGEDSHEVEVARLELLAARAQGLNLRGDPLPSSSSDEDALFVTAQEDPDSSSGESSAQGGAGQEMSSSLPRPSDR